MSILLGRNALSVPLLPDPLIHALYGNRIEVVRNHLGRESIGFYFGLVTDLCGFDQVKGEEWKVMGLAPYGSRDPFLLQQLRRLFGIHDGDLAFADAATIRDVVARIVARRPTDLSQG